MKITAHNNGLAIWRTSFNFPVGKAVCATLPSRQTLAVIQSKIFKKYKMKKLIIILTIASLVYTSCGNSNNSIKERELELREKELKQKEDVLLSDKKKELELKEQELNQKEKDLKPTIKKSNQPKVEQQTNKKYIAIIQDPDGYTNVRNGMSTNAKIIDRLFEGEHYEVFPSSDNNWWVVYTQSNVKGYVHKSRIKIIN